MLMSTTNEQTERMKQGKLYRSLDESIYVGIDVMFAPDVIAATAGHPIDPTLRSKGLQFCADVHIGNNNLPMQHTYTVSRDYTVTYIFTNITICNLPEIIKPGLRRNAFRRNRANLRPQLRITNYEFLFLSRALR